MTTIVGIAGSLRAGSYNRRLLDAAAARAPEGVTIEVGSICGIPLYDADEERERGLPDAVVALKERVAAADGLLLVTPEYNQSIPGCSRTPSTTCRGRPRTSGACSPASPSG